MVLLIWATSGPYKAAWLASILSLQLAAASAVIGRGLGCCSFSSDRQGLGLQRLDSIGGRGGGGGGAGGGVVERHI